MDIPHDTLVLVADGRKLLLLRNEGDSQHPNLNVVTHEERDIPADRDIGTDRPGRSFDSASPGRSAYQETDFHQLEEDRFAADAADELKKRALRQAFDKLIVVAPPKTLGELRKHYHKEVESRLLGEIAKDLTGHPVPEIEQLIAKE